jgi:hypothetical protein
MSDIRRSTAVLPEVRPIPEGMPGSVPYVPKQGRVGEEMPAPTPHVPGTGFEPGSPGSGIPTRREGSE